jgi:methylated-DNA-[protein]-cysteine S-methyltransferase
MSRISLDSPLGKLTVEERDGAIIALQWGDRAALDGGANGLGGEAGPSPVLLEARRQLEDYFAGRRKDFDLPLAASGSDFEQRVWQRMCAIPYGETLTYGQMAKEVGGGDPRAVGSACGSNPIPIIVPCHRVMAAGGTMGGYSGRGGLQTKSKLLALEGALLL